MNRAFTMLELIFVIVIMGILGSISMDILVKMYKNYSYTKEMASLSKQLESALDVFAAKLQNRVKNTLIVAKCTTDDDGCINGDVEDFKSLQTVNANEAADYKVLEWIEKDVYSYRGMWDGKKVAPGWSSFVDLKALKGRDGKYKIISQYSNFNYVQIIDGNWTQNWGIDGYENVFKNKLEAFIFSGSDGRGEITDMNHSFGYYTNLVGDSDNKQAVYEVNSSTISVDENKTEFNISLITDRNNTFAYEVYYLVNGAYAVIPKENKYGYYDLYISQNYYPWKDQVYTDGNISLLVNNVSYFKYKEDNGVIKLYMCLTSTSESLKDYNLTLCKERIVF